MRFKLVQLCFCNNRLNPDILRKITVKQTKNPNFY